MDYFIAEPNAGIIATAIIGLVVGSFLNVVIYRLPIMMKRSWRRDCAELLETSTTHSQERFDLLLPASRCPNCSHAITILENIPIISYILLRGRCSTCQQKISIRYPIIEFVSMLLSAMVAWKFGYGWPLLGALLLTWALLAASIIDLDHYLLPDNIVLPLLWLGILFNLFGTYVDLETSVVGAMFGYLSLWSVYWGFKLITGKEGMGYGDFKLLAALGAWLGWLALPGIIFLSSLVGAVIGISLVGLKIQNRDKPIPFGPFLATAGWLHLMWGEYLISLWF
ncbi:A24 family peptidase [Candidatus Halobeggiatoa sp. HSG11]|nr:A24 family peptidase [Candidatus Halobeggiatoa sp. HSG11]